MVTVRVVFDGRVDEKTVGQGFLDKLVELANTNLISINIITMSENS